MGLSRYTKKLKRIVLNSNPLIKAVTGGVSNSGSGDGAKAVAAKRLISRNEQAGGGQINYNTEVFGDDPEVSSKSAVDRAREAAPTAPSGPSSSRVRPVRPEKVRHTPTLRGAKPQASGRPHLGVQDPTSGRGEAARRLFRDEKRVAL